MTTAPRPPLSRPQRIRYTIYAVGVTIFVLAVVDGLLRWLDGRGDLDLSGKNDRAWRAAGPPWVVGDDGLYHPDPKSDNVVHDHPFRAKKGDAWRVFFIGESFLRGVPYRDVGTIHAWFLAELTARYPRATLEVVNGSMSAINSERVLQNVRYALDHEPDLLIVQACNNEGTLPPSKVTARLHELGTFRAFRKLLRGDDDGPVHTPQDPDVNAVRENFRQNLEAIVSLTAEKGVPLFLLVSPLNRRYEGNEAGLPLRGHTWEERAAPFSLCVESGVATYRSGDSKRALEALRLCDDVEALRWIGLAEFALGDHAAARRSLEAYVEVLPRNRCRPSFQAVVREVARGHGHATLVDLDETISARSPGQLPGPDWFTDYCHLNWEAQGFVADALLDTLAKTGLSPRGKPCLPEQEGCSPRRSRLSVVEEALRRGELSATADFQAGSAR